jgi:hypothetical protein
VVQDVEFYVSTSNPQIINQNTIWNSNKAKIIYNLKVAEGKSLTLSKEQKYIFTEMQILKLGKTQLANGDLGK